MILLSFLLLSVPIIATNILSVVLLNENFLGFFTQACFFSGCVVGTTISASLIQYLSPVKILIVATLLSLLYPIVFPISEIWNDWELIAIVLVLSVLSGIGTSVFQITHAWPMMKIQQGSKRSCSIGFQNGGLVVGGVLSGFLICFPDLIQTHVSTWVMSLVAGGFGVVSLVFILTIKDEEVVVGINQGITLHQFSYFLSYFSIGVRGM